MPRSGSTLLAAILKQNPEFHAEMTSPVAMLFRAMEQATAPCEETSVFITQGTRMALLQSVFDIYYRSVGRPVVFDMSRVWCTRLPLLVKLFPQAKFLVCVREIGWIIDSFEQLYRKNYMVPSAIYGWDNKGTVYSRAMGLQQGQVGFYYKCSSRSFSK